MVTVTNGKTGPAADKPAFWVDGNIHATEVAASAAGLYFLHTLVTQYGKDADVTRVLDTRAFYVCPRINPDGAEWALADKPKWIRSSTRPYPYDEEDIEGLTVEDMDGDGRILQMRIPDPNGLWKAHPEEPRLLIRRDPVESGGTYYRLLPEGRIDGYDGFTLRVKKRPQGLDLNRNFPGSWRQEFEQMGAGPYPTSEPEVRAVVDFITRHTNITGGTAFHTWSGVLLRPFDNQPDDAMPAEDLWVYQAIGKKGTELTGYPAISVHHDFRYHPKTVIGATFLWAFEHLGILSWVVEIWAPMREAGIEGYKYIDWFRDHPPEDDLKLIRWSDEKLGGAAHAGWRPFDHPQLGKVELGGWDRFNAFSNPPPQCLERELARFPKWLIWHALISPKLELVHAGADGRRRRQLQGHAGRAEHGLAAVVRFQARAGAQGRARPGRRDRPAVRRVAGAGSSPRRCRTAGRQGLQAHRRLVLARAQRDRRSREGRMDRQGQGGRRRRHRRAARARGNVARNGQARLAPARILSAPADNAKSGAKKADRGQTCRCQARTRRCAPRRLGARARQHVHGPLVGAGPFAAAAVHGDGAGRQCLRDRHHRRRRRGAGA